MSINCKDLRQYVVRPVLQELNLWSQSAENLLLGTAAQESQLGNYLHQLNGPALGIYQVEPATHDDVWDNCLKYKAVLGSKVSVYAKRSYEALLYNLAYATAIARVIYLRRSAPLPAAEDIAGLARYYKQYYNTPQGKATEQQFMDNYKRYVI